MKRHAVLILKHYGDKVLFVQRAATKKSLPNAWAFPFGTMEPGESAEDTILREAKEELAIDVQVEKFVAGVELPEFGASLDFYLCKTEEPGKIDFDEAEIQQIRWMTFEEFFEAHNDGQIGHGLIYLRKHPEIWKAI